MGLEATILALTLALVLLSLTSWGIMVCMVVCPPNQVQVLKGRGDGSGRDYRLLFDGRTTRIPIVETVQALDTTLLQVDVEFDDLVCADRAMVELQLHAFVSLSRFEPGIHAAIERFLDSSRQEIIDAARRCLKDHLTSLASEVTSQQMREDRAKFSEMLHDEAEDELSELGFVAHSFHALRIAGGMQNVADEPEAAPRASTPP